MDFRLFGEVIAVGGEDEVALGSGREAAVLSLLLLDPGSVVTVEHLVEQLWGEDAPPGAQHAVRVYVSRLRASLSRGGLDESVIVARSGGYLAEVPRSAVDLLLFESLVARARTAQGGKESLRLAERALALWTADPLSGFAYDEFAVRERRRLDRLRLDVIEIWAEAALSVGRSADVVTMVAPLVEEHSYRERLWAHLATALYQEERQAEALRTLATARSAFGEAGLEFGPLLADLETAIFHRDPALAASPIPGPNLPSAVDSFIGRSDEVAKIDELLQKSRLVTLTGPGGCGKSRLAVESARLLLPRFYNRIWLIDLAPLSAAEAVHEAAAQAVGFGPWSRKDPTIALTEWLGAEPALLILDNCEHLIEASASLAHELLRRCPNVRILATTREPLRMAGETVFSVPSLSVPELDSPGDQFVASDAVALFVDRAEEAASQFALTPETIPHVSKTVRMLDGIPLALELAAVRVRTLPVAEIARRLEDVFGALGVASRTALPRHRTLEAALDWSIDLLDDRERELFDRLGVFRSSLGLHAAAAVSDHDNVEVLLAGLVEKSMIVRVIDDELRYRLLEPIRQFAFQRLRREGKLGEVEARRDAFYLTFATESLSPDRRHEDPQWQHRFRRELPNLEASIDSLLQRGKGDEAAELTSVLTWYWVQLGLYDEGRRLVRTVLASGVSIDNETRLSLMVGGILLGAHQGDWEATEALAAEAIVLAERESSISEQVQIFNTLGGLNAQKGNMHDARVWLTKAIEVAAEPAEAVSPVAINLAAASAWAGDPTGAEQLIIERERLAGEPQPGFDLLSALVTGMAARMRGDLDTAGRLFDKATTGFAERGSELHLAYSQFERALVVFEGGALDEASNLCDAILTRAAAGEIPLLPRIKSQLLAARLAAARGLTDRARRKLLLALEEAADTGTVGVIAEAADVAAHLLHSTGDERHAAQLLMSSSSLRQDIELARDPWEECQLEATMAEAGQASLDLPAVSDPDELVKLVRHLTSDIG